MSPIVANFKALDEIGSENYVVKQGKIEIEDTSNSAETKSIDPYAPNTQQVQPFDLYRVFEYAHKSGKHRPVKLRPIYDASSSVPNLAQNEKKEAVKCANQIKLLKAINTCYDGEAKVPVKIKNKNYERVKKEKSPEVKSTIKRLSKLATSVSFKDELQHFIDVYLGDKEKVIRTVFLAFDNPGFRSITNGLCHRKEDLNATII